jgi:hypothetical protein
MFYMFVHLYATVFAAGIRMVMCSFLVVFACGVCLWCLLVVFACGVCLCICTWLSCCNWTHNNALSMIILYCTGFCSRRE